MNAVAQQEAKSVRPQRAEPERAVVAPRVNIIETKDAYILEAEMPGVAKDGLDIRLEENVLTIVGRRQADPASAPLYRESESADFQRAFEVDPSIDTGKIDARIEQGILTLTLPKAEKVKPRRITVS
jgi:HSP20 family protein